MAGRQLANLSKHIKELRIHLCQRSPSSEGARQFIENNYTQVKQNNQGFPILIRECSNIEPKVYARFAYGVERSASLANQPAGEVEKTISSLVHS